MRIDLDHSSVLQRLHGLFDNPAVFNVYQTLVDGGKGRQIRRFLRGIPVESVVDVGCGTGNWTDVTDARYLGVDVSAEFVEAARGRHADRPNTTFLQLDPTAEDVPGRFDLMQMVSVLHHLSDGQVRRLLGRVVPSVRYLFVLDLYPIPWHPIARLLYALDRGDHIRPPAAQRRLIESSAAVRLLREDAYFAPTGVYRHTMFLYENATHS